MRHYTLQISSGCTKTLELPSPPRAIRVTSSVVGKFQFSFSEEQRKQNIGFTLFSKALKHAEWKYDPLLNYFAGRFVTVLNMDGACTADFYITVWE